MRRSAVPAGSALRASWLLPKSWSPKAFGAVLAAVLVLAAGCGRPAGSEQRTLTVLAAASLTESFQELGARYEAEHPGVRVRFDFQGSSTLAEQIKQGRQADVFASANAKNMDKVTELGAAEGEPRTFATNQLTIAVPAENPGHVTSLADLGAPGRKVVTCAPKVPCGSATEKVERAAGLPLQPVSEENDVKSVLRKVAVGEADAGLVYVSDARSAGPAVRSVDFPESGQAINTYPAVALGDAPEPELAADWMQLLDGPGGRQVLAKHGFGTP